MKTVAVSVYSCFLVTYLIYNIVHLHLVHDEVITVFKVVKSSLDLETSRLSKETETDSLIKLYY